MFDTIRSNVKIAALSDPQQLKEIQRRLTPENGWTHKTQVVPAEGRQAGGRSVSKTISKSVRSGDPEHKPKKGRGGHEGLQLVWLCLDTYTNTLTIESSAPKTIWGTNCLVLRYATEALARQHEIAQDETGRELPDPLTWQAMRVDYSTLFDLGSPAQVRDTIRALAAVEITGRQTSHIHGDNGATVAFHGKQTKTTIYDKQAEALLGQPWAAELGEGKLRMEMSVKRRQLKSLSGSKRPTLGEMLTPDYAIHALHREMEHMGLRGMKVKGRASTFEALGDAYGKATALRLCGFIANLADLGKKEVRDSMSRSTYYENMKLLREAGVGPFHSSHDLAGISLSLSPDQPLDERERVNLMWAMGASGETMGSKERTFEDAAKRWNELVEDSLALTGAEARSKLPKEQRERLRGIAQRFTAMERGEDEVEMTPEEIWLDSEVFDGPTNTEAQEVLRGRQRERHIARTAGRDIPGYQALSAEDVAAALESEAATRAEKEAA